MRVTTVGPTGREGPGLAEPGTPGLPSAPASVALRDLVTSIGPTGSWPLSSHRGSLVPQPPVLQLAHRSFRGRVPLKVPQTPDSSL